MRVNQRSEIGSAGLGSWMVVAVMLAATGVVAASGSEGAEEPDWGTSAFHVVTIHSSTFMPEAYTVLHTNDDIAWKGRYTYANGGGTFFAPLALPEGSLVTQVVLVGCDEDASAGIFFTLMRDPDAQTGAVAEGGMSTSGQPGCQSWTAVIGPPLEIDNHSNAYYLEVDLNGDFETRFKSMRVQYMLQVSPAPATATFDDVPTGHWAFQFVEALADSKITAGCSPTSFCPDATLTRAQMAVFLAKALGLSWDPAL